MPQALAALALVFVTGGLGSNLILAKLKLPRWLLAVVSIVAFVGFLVLEVALPFASPWTELLLTVLAALPVSGGMAVFFGMAGDVQKARAAKPAPRTPEQRMRLMLPLLSVALVLPIIAGTLSALMTRWNYAVWLDWTCDGTITEVTRAKSNHMAPTIVVDGRTRFEQVSEDLWTTAKPGQHLTKVAGTPHASLEGHPVRMVPLQEHWWHDPP
jgi:hypothetical protein